ncbi:YD repeat-containing protein [Thermoflavifilum thermophilum]|uniref:YD repeat-containing protein n=2 Tax=Thermoflavifilum thermophilum TaxID=1393122 RepID=A0A1I7NJS2_9BACT|nr:YD repeat-containing protein [Thermoflavifilum thermophilum]
MKNLLKTTHHGNKKTALKTRIGKRLVERAIIFVQKIKVRTWVRYASFMILIGSCYPLHAQYFYQDLYSTWQTNTKQQLYRQWKVKKIQIYSYDANHERDNSFSVEKQFSSDYRELNSTTHSLVNGDSWLISRYDSQYRITESLDSSDFAINLTQYRYDSAGRLKEIDIVSRTPSTAIGETMLTETHIFQYDSAGHPTRMWKIKNQTDTSIARFITDSNGRIIQETDSLDGRIQHFYFTYTPEGWLKTISRYDSSQQKAITTLQLDYDGDGQISQMTVIAGGNGGSTVWTYAYDERHLVQIERCLADGKTFIGSVEYVYDFY